MPPHDRRRSRGSVSARRRRPHTAAIQCAATRGTAHGHRFQSRAFESPCQGRERSRRSRALRRRFLQLAAEPALSALHLRVPVGGNGGAFDEEHDGPSLPRSHAYQGNRHAPADAVAPGSDLLQNRRAAECEFLDSCRSGEPRIHLGVHRGFAPRALADAALIHGLPGEMVSRGYARRSTGHRGATRRISGIRLGTRARRCGMLSHADAACGPRRRWNSAAARFFRALFGRRYHPCTAALEDIAGISRLDGRVGRRSADESLAVPRVVALLMTTPSAEPQRYGHPISWLVFVALWLLAAIVIYRGAADLPPRIAVHFDAAGPATSFMLRGDYRVFMLLFAGGLPALLVGIMTAAYSRATDLKIPNREYWLSPQRLVGTPALPLAPGCLGCADI